MSSKKLTKLTDMFHDAPEEQETNNVVGIEKLIPFHKHPFKLYSGTRLEDMVESVKEYGILTPLLVRKTENEMYEILAGHNRWNAARIAGLNEVPIVVVDVQNDDEAMLIVTETNLIQRSFSELLPSERACVIAQHHEALKCQGKRFDLLEDIKRLLNADEINNSDTFDLIDQKQNSREKVGSVYDLSPGAVARYLRVNILSDKLKNFLDDSVIGLYVAVSISYLSNDNQEYLAGFIDSGKKVDIEKANKLKELQKAGKLNEINMAKVLDGTYKPHKKKSILKGYKIKSNVMKKYFQEEQSEDEVESIIEKALELYFKQ